MGGTERSERPEQEAVGVRHDALLLESLKLSHTTICRLFFITGMF